MNLDKWYRSIVEGNKEIPPESVWEGVQDALDIDLVWGRVEANLNANKKKSIFAPLAVAASTLVAIVVGGAMYYLFFFSNQSIPLAEMPIIPLDRIEIEHTAPTIKLPQRATILAQDIVVSEPRSINTDENLPNEIHGAQVIDNPQDHLQRSLTPISTVTSHYIPVSISTNIQPLGVATKSNESLTNANNTTGTKSLYVGVTGHLANTWLLSSKTLTGLQPDDLTNTNITFGSNFGMQLGTAITPELNIQSDFLWISQNKQQYNEYINGKYVTSALELDYYTLALQGKYRFPTKHTAIFGGYFGLMKTAKQSVDDEIFVLDNDYSNFDYGLIIGYEYPIPLGRRFTFSPGLFAKIGLNNVFAGNEYIPFYLNKTQNASINLSFSVAYNIF